MMSPILNVGAQAPANVIKDTDTAGFKADVMDASMQVPVIVDFWAPWCGPCKTLGPALESAVRAKQGKVRLVKVDIDQNAALAQQLRIQSVPTVYAFFQGRPVDGFAGALPDSQVKAFVDKLVKMSGGESVIEDALAEAKDALDAGDAELAGGIYSQILQQEPGQPTAIAGLARALLALGEMDEARRLLEGVPADIAKHQDIASVRSQIELAEQAAGAGGRIPELRQAVQRQPDDHEARYELAMALFAAGDRGPAVDELLEIVKRDREWNEQAARKQLVKFFEAFGPTDPLTVSARRRLSSILFA
jgi:putative thioredoxin